MTASLRVLVVDDEQLARQRLRRLLGHEQDVGHMEEAGSGAEAVAALAANRYHVLFLDIQMPDMSGFEVLEATPPERRPVTVFVTAHDDYAVRAFDTGAMDYLLKPFTEERFQLTLQRARLMLQTGASEWRARLQATLERHPSSRLLVRRSGGTLVVPTADIDYLSAARNAVRLHTSHGVHRMRARLSEVEQRLDPATFARIHRSTLVNLERIVAIEPLFSGDARVVLRNGVRLRLSRTYRHDFESRISAKR